MKILTRDFTKREKILLLVLGLLIVAMLYYLFIDQPIRSAVSAAESEAEALQPQVDAVNQKVEELHRMEAEMDNLGENGHEVSYMPSYNASKQELDFLNTILASTNDYYIGFSDLTRDGSQLRRSFSLQYRTSTYEQAVNILSALETSENRCMVSNFSVSPASSDSDDILSGSVTVSCQAVFYETTYDGVEDKDLPVDEAAARAAAEAAAAAAE